MDQSPALAALSALAHETRLGIVRLLVRRGHRGVPAGEIARSVRVSASRLSFHLRLLEGAGLIRAERDGRQVIYSLDRAQLGSLIGWLLSDCCADDPEVRACCASCAEDGKGDVAERGCQSTAGALPASSGTVKI